LARPSVRRELKRAGLGPAAGAARPETGSPLAPAVLLPGEEPGAGPLDLALLFGRAAPAELEIGTGKGRFLLAEAAAHPERNYLGLELHTDYARIARERAKKRGLANVRVERVEAKAFVALRLAPSSLARMHVFFPDPWPKKRHHKRRLFDAAFAAAAARALEPGSLLRVASDHEEYFASILETLGREPALARVPDAEAGDWLCGTNYEAKFLAEGRPIGRALFRRVSV
jgi:tRNA (guanine-N7-)-methyltransferase